MTNQEIKTVGQTIAAETQIGGNTAERVGGVIEGIGEALDNKDAAVGYYLATMSGSTIYINASSYRLRTGGNLRAKMPAAATTACTLTVGNANAVPLWYNGAAVSSDNSWEAGEIVTIFYDGTRFMASNSQGGGGQFGSGEKIKDVLLSQVLGAGTDAITSQKGVSDAIFNEIDISSIDTLKTLNDALAPSSSLKPTYYTVTAMLGSVKLKVGSMAVISDNMRHVVTEIMATHYLLDDAGNLTNEHSDAEIFFIYRSVKLSGGTLPDPAGVWTKWRYVNASVWYTAAEKIKYDNSQSGLSAENVQGGLDETVAQIGLATHISSITPTWSNGNINPTNGLNENAQSSIRTNFMDADILKVSCDSGYFIKGVFAYDIRNVYKYHGTLYYGYDGNNWDTSKREVIIPCKEYAVRITIGRTDLSSISTTESSHIQVDNIKFQNGESVVNDVQLAKNGSKSIDYSSYIMAGCGLGSNGNWRTGMANVDCAVIPCMGNTYYKLKATGDTFGRYSFFVNNILVSDNQAPFCEGYSSNGVMVNVGDDVTVKSPSNARYLYVLTKSGGVNARMDVSCQTDFFNYAEKNYVNKEKIGNITNPSENITINGQGSTTAISSYIPCKPNTRYVVISDKQQWDVPSPDSDTTGFRISEHKDSSSSSYWTAVRYSQTEIAGSPIPEKIYFTTQDQTNYIRISIAAIEGVEINVSIAQVVEIQSMDDAVSYQEVIQPVVIGNYTGKRIVLDESLTYQKTKFMQFGEDKLIFQSMDFCENDGVKYGLFILKPYDNETPYGYLYDMSRRMKMQDITFPIPSGYSLCHANASFFLKDNYYDENSVLPMFAINMWQSEKVVFIYDFNEESLTDEYGNSYTSVRPILRYTIEPDSSIRNLSTYIDFISDDTQTYLWALGWTMNCYKFPFPNLESGTTTTIGDFTFKKSVLNYSDRIENFSVGSLKPFQDKCYSNGKIFVNYGEVGGDNPLSIAVIDTVEKVRSNTIDLSCDMLYAKYRIPYVQNRETQGLAILDNHLMLTYWKEDILWQFTL